MAYIARLQVGGRVRPPDGDRRPRARSVADKVDTLVEHMISEFQTANIALIDLRIAEGEVGRVTDAEQPQESAAVDALPVELLQRRPLARALGYLYALEGVLRSLRQVDKLGYNTAAGHALGRLKREIPDLVRVRDSGYRSNDGVLAKAMARHSDDDGTLQLNMLMGDVVVSTDAKGERARVPVDESTLDSVRQILQDFIDGLAWSSSQPVPRPG